MNRIDFYTGKVFLGAFFGSLAVFATLFLAVDAMGTLVKFSGTPLSSVVTYYLFYLPEVLSKMIPMACVMATVMMMTSLNRAGEMVALFAAGIESFGGLHCAGFVKRDEGIEVGLCFRARQRRRGQRLAADLAGAEIGGGLRGGELVQIDRRLRHCGRRCGDGEAG